jgi:hypothetical protein
MAATLKLPVFRFAFKINICCLNAVYDKKSIFFAVLHSHSALKRMTTLHKINNIVRWSTLKNGYVMCMSGSVLKGVSWFLQILSQFKCLSSFLEMYSWMFIWP